MGTKFILGQEDGTVAGGDPRGANAIDLQTRRALSNQVASAIGSSILGGTSNKVNTSGGSANNSVIVAGNLNTIQGNNKASVFIGAGSSNTIDGNASVIVGGNSNTSYANSTFIGGGDSNAANGTLSVIVGGSNNQSNANYTTVGGGQTNSANSSHSTVSGGQSNTASTNTHATVVGGQGNVSSGVGSINGGIGNIASAYASVAFGESTQATAGYAIAMGNSSRATSSNAIALGFQNYATNYGSVGIGGAYTNAYIPYSISTGDLITTRGDAQFTSYITRVSSILISGGTVNLTNSGGYLQGLPNGNNCMWKVKVEYVGTITTITGTATGLTVGDSVYGEENFGFKKLAGTSTMGPIMNETQSSDNAIMDTCSLVVTAGASQEMALTFTGPTFAGGGSVTMRVVAKVALVEVAF